MASGKLERARPARPTKAGAAYESWRGLRKLARRRKCYVSRMKLCLHHLGNDRIN